MKKIKPYVSRIVCALLVIGIVLFIFLYPRSDNDPLYRAFEENQIVYEINNPAQRRIELHMVEVKGKTVLKATSVWNTPKGKELFLSIAPSLTEDDISPLRWGNFICLEEEFSGMFFRFQRNAREMYAAAEQADEKIVLAGKYILVLACDDELPQKLQNVISKIGGITEKNF